MHIFLNGTKYELEGGVVRTAITEWADNIRYDGQQQRKDRRYMSTWAFDNWANGLGIRRWDVNRAAKQNGLWDAENVDTRNDQIVLAPAFNTCTIVPSNGHLEYLLQYDNQVYFLDGQTPSINGAGMLWKFSTPNTLGSNTQIASGGGNWRVGSPIGGAYVVGKTILFLGRRISDGEILLNRTTDGTIPDGLTVIGTINFPPIPGFIEFAAAGATIHMLARDGTNVMFTIVPTMGSAGSVLGRVATLPDRIGSYLPELQTDGVTVYAQLPDGIYNFDSTPAKVIDTTRSEDSNGALGMFQNTLFFKNYKSWIGYDGSVLTYSGYDKGDGLPSDKMGEILCVTTNWKYTYAAVKGASYCHILTRDSGGAWQYYTRIPTMGLWVRKMILSAAPDGIDRLWCLFDNYGFPGYFLNPVVSPLQAGTYSFVPSGHFTPPLFDGGLPEHQAGFYRLAVSGRADATQGVRVYYGLDTADPVVTLGDVASHSQAFVMGSPSGLAAYSIQPKFMLFRGDPGTTPEFYSSVISYLKKPDIREQYDFVIDLKQTANSLKGQIPLEAVVGSLNYIRQLRTLVPFWYGYTGTRYVSIIDIPAAEQVNDARIREGEREGLIQIRAIEMTL